MLDSPRRGLLRLAGALVLALLAAAAGSTPAAAQGSTVYQNGTAIANHLAKFVTNGRIADVGGILGDANGLGVAPFAIYDNGSLGLCSDNASTLGTYSSICLGHDSVGNAVIQYVGSGGLEIQENGVVIPLPGSLTGLPAVIDNATLLTEPSSFGTAVVRLDYAIGNGAPPIVYRSSSSACSLNAGAGDNGSQIKSSDGKCWIASFPAGGISPLDFGAKCDGTTDDTAAVQNTVNAAAATKGPGVVRLGNYLCSITSLTINGGVKIEGSANGSFDGHPSGFQAGATNANLITIPAGNPPVILRNFSIAAAFGGVKNTAGVIISNKSNNTITEGLYIADACTAIAEDGNSNIYRDLKIYSITYDQTGCDLVKIGDATTSGTVDARFLNITINGQGSDATHNAFTGFFIYDCGGCYFSNNDVLFTQIGTAISPGSNQAVHWNHWSNTVLGDSTSSNGLDINTAAASGSVRGLQFSNVWIGCSGNYRCLGTYTTASGVNINNGGGGIVDGLHFVGARIFSASKNGFNVAAGTDVSIDASTICGPSASGALQGDGVYILSGVNGVAVRNNTIRAVCDAGGPNNMGYPILLGGSNNEITIIGNYLNGTGDGIGLSGPITNGNSMVISKNLGIDDQVLTAAAASTLDPHTYSTVYVTGAGTVQNILSGWAGREMLVVTAGAVTFAATGTAGQSMCGALTTSAGGFYRFVYFAGLNCWGHS